MKLKVKCPSCANDIRLLTILIALAPFSFMCWKCKTRIYIRGIVKLIMLNLIVMGLLAVFTLQYLHQIGVFETEQYHYLLIPVFIMILMEVIRGLMVCNMASLKIKKKNK